MHVPINTLFTLRMLLDLSGQPVKEVGTLLQHALGVGMGLSFFVLSLGSIKEVILVVMIIRIPLLDSAALKLTAYRTRGMMDDVCNIANGIFMGVPKRINYSALALCELSVRAETVRLIVGHEGHLSW